MKTSTTITKIAPALLAAQKEIGSASKGAVNPFGEWIPIKESRLNNRKSLICKCSCGNINNITLDNLTRGKSKSCGKCLSPKMTEYKKEYNVWAGMKSRCLNKNHNFYKDYGLRGITISKEWLLFDNFIRDMGHSNGLTFDRIDNNKGYSKENCKWSTKNRSEK